jgi:hypothetical protein
MLLWRSGVTDMSCLTTDGIIPHIANALSDGALMNSIAGHCFCL